jgi:hypothetical protein
MNHEATQAKLFNDMFGLGIAEQCMAKSFRACFGGLVRPLLAANGRIRRL